VQTAAQAIGQQLIMRDVSSDRDIDMAFATFGTPDGAGSLLVCGGAFMFSKRELVAALAARYALPAIYTNREAVVNGGETNYVMATLKIYIDIYNIFVNLLNLLLAFAGNRD
jgi:hypothetical protein